MEQAAAPSSNTKPKRSAFPPLFYLSVIFEFFERGSYYGVMSVFSVYLTDHLHFAKEDVGVIKGTIQPLLYFLPIISGALADRFGYRRTLLVAFSLLGGGYLLTSQAVGYAAVFLALVVMGIGAGTFKPVISGTIARTTDKTNSTLGFGIFYWSINLGAFLVPLFIVPYLKNNVGWDWVLIAAAIGTGSMLLPTIFLYREPPAPKQVNTDKPSLLQTLANAFEIIYSPFILLYSASRRSVEGRMLTVALCIAGLGGGLWAFFRLQSFLPLFVALLLSASLTMMLIKDTGRSATARTLGPPAIVLLLLAVLWLAPQLSLFARILCSVIGLTLLSLLLIDHREPARFRDHLRFLLMIFIYSGFWVLYFQMFDSVLWYVQAYVDASSLNSAVNSLLAMLGLQSEAGWRFDIEHVTVINAGTIILLQLLISNLVKNTRALPTMVVGICLGTAGMAILAVSPSIWVFILGITIFSVGEMTAHPKFISYVGQTAPKNRVAMYMGYLFLYGVIGSSIGAPLGAKLYVIFVDQLNRPRTLWLIFSCIGVATAIGLLLYNKFLAREPTPEEQGL